MNTCLRALKKNFKGFDGKEKLVKIIDELTVYYREKVSL